VKKTFLRLAFTALVAAYQNDSGCFSIKGHDINFSGAKDQTL
jgi:hypothetical protein